MKNISLLLLIATLLSACVGNSSTTIPLENMQPIPPPQVSVSCVGDSETSGWVGGTSEANYSLSWCNKLTAPILVGKISPVSGKVSIVSNYAQPSKDITQIYNEQLPLVLSNPTNVVVIMTGVNDSYHNIPLDVFKSKYINFLNLVKAKGMKPYCLTSIPTNTLDIITLEYDKITLIMTEQGCTVIDVATLYKPSWHDITGDIHPSALAYEEIALALLLKL